MLCLHPAFFGDLEMIRTVNKMARFEAEFTSASTRVEDTSSISCQKRLEPTGYYGVTPKKGYTLIEVMVVVAIMGILSSMGVASLRQAIENKRVEDAARNIAAFMERTASESKRLSSPLCLTASGQQLLVTKGHCIPVDDGQSNTNAAPLYTFELDPPMHFSNTCPTFNGCNANDDCSVNLIINSNGEFTPQIGNSAVPSGFICAQYGSTAHYAAALKRLSAHSVAALAGYSDDNSGMHGF